MDLAFIGPIIGGALALLGTTYLAFSANKRESIASAERQLTAWQKILFSLYLFSQTSGHPFEESVMNPLLPSQESRFPWAELIAQFVGQGAHLWGDEWWATWNSLAENFLGHTKLTADDYQDKSRKLKDAALNRTVQFSKTVEDLKRRSVWTFIRTHYLSQPDRYRFLVMKGYDDPHFRNPL